MRRAASREVRVPAGGSVVIRASITRKCQHARLFLWSKGEGEDYSPFIPFHEILGSFAAERPVMVKPVYFTLTEDLPTKKLQFVAEETTWFKVVQEVDVDEDPSPKVRIRGHGKAVTAGLEYLRNAVRTLRRHPLLQVGNR